MKRDLAWPQENSSEIDVSALDAPGRVRLVASDAFGPAFIARIPCERRPPGAVPTDTDGQYLVAFSRLCTHMGAHLVAPRHDATDPRSTPIASLRDEGVMRCPCHLTAFDLGADGLVVVGQATARLPRIDLESVNDGKVRLVRKVRLAYGETDV